MFFHRVLYKKWHFTSRKPLFSRNLRRGPYQISEFSRGIFMCASSRNVNITPPPSHLGGLSLSFSRGKAYSTKTKANKQAQKQSETSFSSLPPIIPTMHKGISTAASKWWHSRVRQCGGIAFRTYACNSYMIDPI